MTLRTLALLTVATLAAACSSNDTLLGVPNMDEDVQGRMVTDRMPEVGSFDDRAERGYLWKTSDWFDMSLHAVGPYGWAMVGVFAMVDESGEVVVEDGSVIGCTGPEDGWADFDEPAQSAEVRVDRMFVDGQELVRITVDAIFDGRGTVHAVAEAPIE
ncbi:MAG: hypothetical protein H6736_18100 [Alphaproteobacteria bacterium]|nr:hypothetical protein [Alphaproteobacteria bacterium]MCB9693727.1 hypothetical protein [Alphaproteobacteria bacterium]